MYIYYWFLYPNYNRLHISQWLTLLIQCGLFLYIFQTNLLYYLNMWLIASSLYHLLFICDLSTLSFIYLNCMALSLLMLLHTGESFKAYQISTVSSATSIALLFHLLFLTFPVSSQGSFESVPSALVIMSATDNFVFPDFHNSQISLSYCFRSLLLFRMFC